MISYLVLGKCSWTKESKAPYLYVNTRNDDNASATNPFAVDRHVDIVGNPHRLDFIAIAYVLHISGIATSSENAGDLRARINVVGGDQGTSGVVDQGRQLDWQLLCEE